MKFKKGAFVSDKPIKIMALKWGGDRNFSTSMANINVIACIFLTFLQPSLTLEVHEVEQTFDPNFSYKRRNVKNQGEDTWEYVAEDVKSIISFMTGFEGSEQGFKESKACEIMHDGLTLGIEFGFSDKRTAKNPGFLANDDRKYWRIDKNNNLEAIPRNKD
jgi:hypothetical protein